MDADIRMQKNLAKAIRANVEKIDQRLEQKFVEEYPHSPANFMDAKMIHEWAMSEIEILCEALDADDISGMSYTESFGDMYREPHDRELSSFFTFIGAKLFMARHIALIIFRTYYSDPKKASDLLVCLEEFTQRIIQKNLEQFSRDIGEQRSLIKRWDLFFDEKKAADFEDTPSKRHLSRPRNEQLESAQVLPSSTDELSKREEEILDLIVAGKTNSEIASSLDISRNTVKNHVAHIFDKYNVNSRAELMARFISGLMQHKKN